MWIITAFTKMLHKCPPGPRTSDRDVGTSLSLKITQVRVLNLKFKESVSPLKLYTSFSLCVHFSEAGIFSFHQIPRRVYEQCPHPTDAPPPKAKTY